MPEAMNPMDPARQFVNERIRTLRQQFAFGRVSAASYQQQMKELLKQKYDKLSGTFVEK